METQERKYERIEGKFAYLSSYLGKPFSVSCRGSAIEGILQDVDLETMTATIKPTILYDSKGKPYLETNTPTTISLLLLDLTKFECVIQPIRSLEERISYKEQVNAPRAKVGF